MKDFSNEESDKDTVEQLRQVKPTSQGESLKTIDRANKLGMHADDYLENKEDNDFEIDIQERTPSKVDNAINNYSRQSTQHSNATKDEKGVLQTISNMASNTWYNLSGEKNRLEDEKQKLLYRGLWSENGLSESDRSMLDTVTSMQQEEITEFDLEGLEIVPGAVAGVINDAFNAIGNHPNLIKASAMIGAGLGLWTPFIGTTAAGFTTGIGIGITTAMVTDAYHKTTNNMFGDILTMKNKDGSPLNLPHSTARNISIGVGLVSGAAEAATAGVLTFGAGKLVGFTGEKLLRKTIENVPLTAKMDALGHIMASSGVSSLEEISADVIARIGEHLAKGEDASIGGITTAIGKTIDDFSDPKFLKQLGMTGLVGGLASGTIASTTSALSYKGIKNRIERQNLTIEETKEQQRQSKALEDSLNILTAQDKFLSMSKLTVDTEFKKLSPSEMTELKQRMFVEAGYTDKLWFSEADMMKIREINPELEETIRGLDVTGSVKFETGAPFGIKVEKFSDLVDEFPTVTEFARLNPDTPNPLESKAVLARLEANKQKKEAYLNDIGVGTVLSPEQLAELEIIENEGRQILTNASEQSYLAGKDVEVKDISDTKLKAFNKAQSEARAHVAEQINIEFLQREEKIENRVVKANVKIEKRNQRVKLKKELGIVERFRPTSTKVEGKTVKTDSPLVIDPESLPAEFKEAYMSEPTLKKRKVFKKGGMTLEESAALAGAKDGQELLQILANTPNEKELTKLRQEKAKQIRKQVREVRDKTLEGRRDKLFDDIADLDKREMDYLREKQWTGTKQGLKVFMLETGNKAIFNHRARIIVRNTKVSEISSRQYNQGKRHSEQKTAEHILKNETDQAVKTKEQSMLNSELTRESLKMESQLNDARIWLKDILLTEKSNRILKRAGLLDQSNDILSIFNLLPSKQKGVTQDSYFKYLANLEKQGKSVIVPEALSDVRQRGTDLNAEQFLQVTDRLKTLLHQARSRNGLITRIDKITKAKKVRTEAAQVEELALELEEHPKYNEKRVKKVINKGSISAIQKIFDFVGVMNASSTNLKNVILQSDQEQLSGSNQEAVAEPMNESETFKREMLFNNKEQIIKIGTDYGDADFKAAFNEKITIPEFEGYEHLGNGGMLKADLWYLMAYMGDPDAREQMGNFTKTETTEVSETGATRKTETENMDIETVKRVLEQHLTIKDAKLVQNFVNIFKSTEQASVDLQARTTGTEVTSVKGVPWEFKGIMIDGGYVPESYLGDTEQARVERFLDTQGDRTLSQYGDDPRDKSKLYAKLRSAGQTEQGRLIARKGSNEALDTNFLNFINAYEEIAHDLAYRENGAQVLKLLNNKVYAFKLKSVVGVAKYNLLTSAVIETVGNKTEGEAIENFNEIQKIVRKSARHLEQAYAIKVLGFAYKSVMMQPLSIGSAKLRMGKKGSKHLLKGFAQAANAIATDNYGEFMENAIGVNRDLKFNNDNVDDTLNRSLHDTLPKTRLVKNKGALIIAAGLEYTREMSMMGLQQLDIHIKAAVSMGAASQFLSGDVKGFPLSKLEKMTEAQKIKEMRRYVKQIADLALTTSAKIDKNALEKIEFLRPITRFYTDRRSQFLTGTAKLRETELEVRRGIKSIKQGEVTDSIKHGAKASAAISSMMLIHTLNQLYNDELYDRDTPLDDVGKVVGTLKDTKDFRSLKKFIGEMGSFAIKASPSVMASSLPIASDIQFALGGFKRIKKARTIPGQMMSDVANTIVGINDLLNNRTLDPRQVKSIGGATSILVGGIPVHGPIELAKIATKSEAYRASKRFLREQISELDFNIDKYIDEFKNDPDKQDIVDGLKEVQEKFIPQDSTSKVPENSQEKLKLNKWDDINPVDGAAGIYQFTEERWDELQDLNPSLDLTDEGRTDKDSEQQEIAMEYSLKENAKDLNALNIEVNSQSLYGAHRFGLDEYALINFSDDSEKLSELFRDLTPFTGFTTVKSVKDFISKQIEIDKK